MNLVEKLLAVDKGEFEKIEKKQIPSERLSNLLGIEAKVTIRAIGGDLFSALTSSGINDDGTVDYGRLFDTNAKVVAEGVIDPNLKDEALLKHLGVPTPAEAAKKIFKGEVNGLSGKIAKLSGFDSEEKTDKEIKN